MAIVRSVAIALALCTCTALAQEHRTAALTVDVMDLTGARIPGARIVATNETTSSRSEAKADANGQAALNLALGTYELKVQAHGFVGYVEKAVEVGTEIHRKVTLPICCQDGPIVVQQVAPILPEDHQSLAMEIPLIPMQQFSSPDKPLRRRLHWF